jgi:hypothetical protein
VCRAIIVVSTVRAQSSTTGVTVAAAILCRWCGDPTAAARILPYQVLHTLAELEVSRFIFVRRTPATR